MTSSAAPQKTEKTENFPVASLMLGARVRPHVLAFYRFARQADDIADSPNLSASEKLERLETMRKSLQKDDLATPYLNDLLTAFTWDAEDKRYDTWDVLMGYCIRSAAPVGRFLLDLHGELTDDSQEASDALCAALQITNHLQDCGADYKALKRVYIPISWLDDAGLSLDVLNGDVSTPAFRALLDRALDHTDMLIKTAMPLPRLIKNFGLRIQAEATVQAAKSLALKLRNDDPLARRVELTFSHKLSCAMQGMVKGWFRR